MKIYIENGVVFAQAETLNDVSKLMAFGEEVAPQKPMNIQVRKRQNKEECDICSKSYKGLRLHKRKVHGVFQLNVN